jgi:hypothetical protein
MHESYEAMARDGISLRREATLSRKNDNIKFLDVMDRSRLYDVDMDCHRI